MPTSLVLDTARGNDGKIRLTAAGEIDMSNIDAFDQALASAVAEAANDGGMLTVDLRAVDYLDSAAISALFARADDIQLIAHPMLMPILKVSGLVELVPIEAAPPAADD